jgi:F-type H+-transporting ATPase subunit delta
VIDLRAVRRYSQALYQMSERAGSSDVIDDQLVAIKGLTEKHPEITNLVSNSTIALTEKEDFISKIVPQETNLLLVNFLKVLVKKKRFSELRWIQEEFHRLYEKQRRVEEVTAISAVPLSEANLARLEKMLAAKLKSDIRLVTKTDPKMIGGLVIRFAGNEINAAFRSRLESIAQSLS